MLPNYLLSNLGDRMEMAHSVEGRVPFLDHKLVEFVTTLPLSFKIRNMNEKYILREALQPVISKTVYERRKHPFIAPPYTKKKQGPMFSFISEYINDNLNTLPFFDRKKIAKVLKDIQTAPPQTMEGTDIFFMTLASILALQEQFGIKNAS
jgi:asparagine synthase (glutamine-hydrolysing)